MVQPRCDGWVAGRNEVRQIRGPDAFATWLYANAVSLFFGNWMDGLLASSGDAHCFLLFDVCCLFRCSLFEHSSSSRASGRALACCRSRGVAVDVGRWVVLLCCFSLLALDCCPCFPFSVRLYNASALRLSFPSFIFLSWLLLLVCLLQCIFYLYYLLVSSISYFPVFINCFVACTMS